MSRSRQFVSPTTSDARNASADENASASKPNCRSKSGSDSRTDSSSSTTDTTKERLSVMTASSWRRIRSALKIGGDRKRESGTRTIVRLRPQAAVMLLDDRAADRQPDAHAVALRRVKGVKQSVHALAIDAHAGVAHAHAHMIGVLALGDDTQAPLAIVHVAHRVAGVPQQVENDLLKLDPVASEGREILSEFRLQSDAVSLKIAQRQR